MPGSHKLSHTACTKAVVTDNVNVIVIIGVTVGVTATPVAVTNAIHTINTTNTSDSRNWQ